MTSTTKKAESLTRFGVKILTSKHPAIKKLRKTYPTSIHGNKLWSSSYLLMDYFKKNPPNTGTHIMELGCGWGLTSIYMAKTFGCTITAVDADSDVFPYLHLHAETNKIRGIETRKKRFEQLRKKDFEGIDLLIAADVCFWDEMTDLHRKLIKRAINAGVKKIVYADPMRQPFLDLAEICIEKYYADFNEVSLSKPEKASGAVMVIENA